MAQVLKQGADYKNQVLVTCDNGDGTYDVTTLKGDRNGTLKTIDYWHDIVHRGLAHTFSDTREDVASNGYYRIRISTGNKALHLEINYTGELKTRLKTFYNPTITTNGTLYTNVFNRIAGLPPNIETEFYVDATYTAGAETETRGRDFSGSNTGTGGGAVRVGGGRSGGLETVITPNSEYIIEFQNVGDNPSDINVILNMYESNQIITVLD